jgi:hypothetical protein
MSQGSPEPPAGRGWRAIQRAAGERLNRTVEAVLLDLARAAWGPGQGRDWQIVRMPAEAAWRLHRLVEADGGDYAFQQLGVRATVAPDGAVVALQVDDGDEFLALADSGPASLRRGLDHLLAQQLPIHRSAQPPFAPAARGPLRSLGRLLSRLSGRR